MELLSSHRWYIWHEKSTVYMQKPNEQSTQNNFSAMLPREHEKDWAHHPRSQGGPWDDWLLAQSLVCTKLFSSSGTLQVDILFIFAALAFAPGKIYKFLLWTWGLVVKKYLVWLNTPKGYCANFKFSFSCFPSFFHIHLIAITAQSKASF